jgi:hypothetical protein
LSLDQKTANHVLVITGWFLTVASLLGGIVCLYLWWTDTISDRAMLGITLALSWLAITISGATFLLEAVVKKNVD